MRLILLGPPGSGKGTQGDLIQDKFGLPKISSGDLLRNAVKEKTSLGKKAQQSIQKGELVNDRIIIDLIKQRISKKDCRNGYTLDGFPRNIFQACFLEEVDPGKKERVIDIQVSEDTVMKRLSSRYICSECNNIYNIDKDSPLESRKCERCGGKLIQRQDDRPEVIQKRLAVYHQETEKLISYYKKKGVYRAVDGESSVEKVFERISSIINKNYNQSEKVEVLT